MPRPARIGRAGHPRFARTYLKRSPLADERGGAEHRAQLLRDVGGRVVEIGAGGGATFTHYSERCSVVAIEPEPSLRAAAGAAAADARARIEVVDAVAEALPVRSGAADVVVTTLTLCSVDHQEATLRELHRVLRAGGELRFYEHVIDPRPHVRLGQRAASPLWQRLAGGCRLQSDPVGLMEAVGFAVTEVEVLRFRPRLSALLTEHHVLGVAVKR